MLLQVQSRGWGQYRGVVCVHDIFRLECLVSSNKVGVASVRQPQ